MTNSPEPISGVWTVLPDDANELMIGTISHVSLSDPNATVRQEAWLAGFDAARDMMKRQDQEFSEPDSDDKLRRMHDAICPSDPEGCICLRLT
jgi:hypothetical protein